MSYKILHNTITYNTNNKRKTKRKKRKKKKTFFLFKTLKNK